MPLGVTDVIFDVSTISSHVTTRLLESVFLCKCNLLGFHRCHDSLSHSQAHIPGFQAKPSSHTWPSFFFITFTLTLIYSIFVLISIFYHQIHFCICMKYALLMFMIHLFLLLYWLNIFKFTSSIFLDTPVLPNEFRKVLQLPAYMSKLMINE